MDRAPIWLDAAWQATVLAWIDERLGELGLERAGPVEQPHIRPWSTVMTVPMGDGTVSFKAAGPGTAYEARLLHTLAGWEAPMLLAPWPSSRTVVGSSFRMAACGYETSWKVPPVSTRGCASSPPTRCSSAGLRLAARSSSSRRCSSGALRHQKPLPVAAL
jgi:hypothetical protein